MKVQPSGEYGLPQDRYHCGSSVDDTDSGCDRRLVNTADECIQLSLGFHSYLYLY